MWVPASVARSQSPSLWLCVSLTHTQFHFHSDFPVDFPCDEIDWSTSFDFAILLPVSWRTIWFLCHHRCFHLFIHYVWFLSYLFSFRHLDHISQTMRCMYVCIWALMVWWFSKEIANFLAIHIPNEKKTHTHECTCVYALMMHIPIECVLKQSNHRQG